MIPYLHLGPLNLPTFGLMVATGLLAAAYIMQADLRRRGIPADAFLIIGIAGLAGIAGARFYHLLEPEVRPEFFAHPGPLVWSRFGFAWFGGLLGGFAALVVLAWREKIPILTFLDACSPAAAAGYAIGRIGCLLSGDGDYGIPTKLPWGMSFPDGVVPTTETCVQQGWPANCRVHPTPLYEFFIWMLIAYVLWRIGAYVLQHKKSAGLVFCAYLVLTGIARFLVEIIRLNPHSFLGMSNAQAASVASVLIGIALLYFVRKGNSSSAPSAVKPTHIRFLACPTRKRPASLPCLLELRFCTSCEREIAAQRHRPSSQPTFVSWHVQRASGQRRFRAYWNCAFVLRAKGK